MAASHIGPDLRRFVLAVIPSVPHLEALLLLRDAPGGLSAAELGARLYVSPTAAEGLVADLAERGLADWSGGMARVVYPGADAQRLVDELAGVYSRHVVAVSELIHSTTDHKAYRFADAFRLRREPE